MKSTTENIQLPVPGSSPYGHIASVGRLAALRRLAAHPDLSLYWRIAALIVALNLVFLVYGANQGILWEEGGLNLPDLTLLSDAAIINLFIAIIIRQQRVVNFLFWLATRAPTSWPLPIRAFFGKVFHFGGIHVGGAVAGVGWFLGFLFAGWLHLLKGSSTISPFTVVIAGFVAILLILIVVGAYPRLRAKHHDFFERTHRFGGWMALLLLWVMTISFLSDQNQPILSSMGFWLLAIITLSIISPWLSMRRVPIKVVKPSAHAAVLYFDYGVNSFPGSTTTLSLNPLSEWHPFATVTTPGKPGYRQIISRAGNWTGDFIDNPPNHIWTKGIVTSGVARIETLFKRVVYVATGSGIGPVIPHLLANKLPIFLVWSVPSPRQTYGDELVDEVLDAVPDALVWDTTLKGRPDLAVLALDAVNKFDAEAVICIANQKLTRYLVYEMECRGIPAYGAIWDS